MGGGGGGGILLLKCLWPGCQSFLNVEFLVFFKEFLELVYVFSGITSTLTSYKRIT